MDYFSFYQYTKPLDPFTPAVLNRFVCVRFLHKRCYATPRAKFFATHATTARTTDSVGEFSAFRQRVLLRAYASRSSLETTGVIYSTSSGSTP